MIDHNNDTGTVGQGVSPFMSKLKIHPWLKRTTFYPAEFILMLLTSLSILTTLSFLGGTVVSYWIDGASNNLMGTAVMYMAASLLVVAPLHLLFYLRVRHTDSKTLSQLARRVSNGALGLYLIILIGVIIGLDTHIVYTLLQWAFGVESSYRSVWTTIAVLGQALIWLKYSLWHFAKLRKGGGKPRTYAMLAGTTVLIVVVLGIIYPGSVGRAAARDAIKVDDLNAIENAIDSYVDENGNLPNSLDDLEDLEKDVKSRLGKYGYEVTSSSSLSAEYEICATFETDNSRGLSSSSSFSFYYHGEGRQCFERTSYGSSYPRTLEDSDALDSLQDSFDSNYLPSQSLSL